MRMKEAQTLGILAMIAVGIILLCMWGGGAQTEDVGNLADQLVDASDSTEQQASAERQRVAPRQESTSEREQVQEQVGSAFANRNPDPAPEDATTEADDPVDPIDPTQDPENIGMRQPETEDERVARPREARYHVGAEGDRLWNISEHYYGTGIHHKKLARVNRDVCPNPNRMRTGVKLLIPREDELDDIGRNPVTADRDTTEEESAQEAESEGGADGPLYVVQQGDSLYKIARIKMGDGGRWKEILRLNREKIKDADTVPVGTKLRLPNP